MKFTLLATTALVLVAAHASALTYDTQGDKTAYSVSRGRIDSGDANVDRAFYDNRSDIWAGFRCGTPVSVTVIQKLSDGTVVQTSAAQPCDTTQRWVSSTGPQPGQAIAISPTTAVSNTTGGVSATVIETKR